MTESADADVFRIDISDVKPIKVLGDLRWTGRAKFPGAVCPRSIVIFQLGEEAVAISAFCPHEQADMSEGRFVEPYVIECPLHQDRYDLRTGAIKTFSVQLEGDGMFLLWRRGANEPVVPQLTQIRVAQRTREEQSETLEQELQALREAHMVETLQQMEGMVREVEDKKRSVERSHAELAKVNEFVKRVTDSMSEVLLVLDIQGRVREVNRRFTSLLGFSRDEARDMDVTALVVAERSERGSLRPFDERALSGEREAEIDACLLRKDGARIEHLVRVAPLYGPSGKREGAVLVCTDIQVVKTAQRELRVAYTELQNLLDNMHQAVFVVVASGEIIQPVSRHTAQLFGGDIVGKNVFDVLFRDLPRTEPVYSGLMTASLTTFGAESSQWDLMAELFPHRVPYRRAPEDPTSDVSVLEVEYCPLYDAREQMDKLMLIVEDVSKLEQRERQLSELRTQILEELAKHRGEQLREFLGAAYTQLRDARRGVEQRDPAATVALFRHLHTLKGNARVLGLSLISRAAHETEMVAEPLQRPEGDSPMRREKVRDALADLQRQLSQYADVAERILHVPNEIEARGGADLHRAMLALDAQLVQLTAALKSEHATRTLAASLHDSALACREAGDTLGSDPVRQAAEALQHVLALFTRQEPRIESSVIADLHARYERLLQAALARRVGSQIGAPYSLSTSGWTALYLDVYTLSEAVLRPDARRAGPLSIERAAERALSSAGTLRAEYVLALLSRMASTARQAHDQAELVESLRELWRHLLLHANLESLSLLRVEERRALLDALGCAGAGDQALISLLESGQIRAGSVVGFFGALRRAGTPAAAVLSLLSALFNEPSPEHIAKLLVSSRALEADDVARLLGSVDALTCALGFDTWAIELGFALKLFSHSGRQGYGYLKRLDTLRLTHAVRELLAGHFQLLFERVQTVEVMAHHFAQLQRRLGDYKRDKTDAALDALELTIAQLLDVPVIPSLYKYSSLAAEIAARLGKRVTLQIHGDSTAALPREHLYPLHDALVHLLRNALDHGLEEPEERSRAGKPALGTIEIACTREAEQIKVVLGDDGRGIDPQRIKRKAIDLKLITEEAAARYSSQQLMELVFLPHFSTARDVTDISGRGIGMDVVRETLARIGAQLSVHSTVGVGTTFSIQISPAHRLARTSPVEPARRS